MSATINARKYVVATNMQHHNVAAQPQKEAGNCQNGTGALAARQLDHLTTTVQKEIGQLYN